MARMLSKNGRKVLAILSVVEGCAMLAERESLSITRNKTRIKYCEAIRKACEKAHKSWKDIQGISLNDVEALGKILSDFEKRNQDLISAHGTRTLLNFSLGLVDDLEEAVSAPDKKAALQEVQNKVFQFVQYLDRNLSHPSIDDAIKLLNDWPFKVQDD